MPDFRNKKWEEVKKVQLVVCNESKCMIGLDRKSSRWEVFIELENYWAWEEISSLKFDMVCLSVGKQITWHCQTQMCKNESGSQNHVKLNMSKNVLGEFSLFWGICANVPQADYLCRLFSAI